MTFRAGVLTFALASVCAVASADPLVPVDVPDGQVRIDGALRDWQGVSLESLGSAGRQIRFAVGRDASALYVAARVFDDRLVRDASVSANNDAVVFTVAVPANQGWRTSEVWLFPGDLNHIPAAAAVGVPGQAPRAASAIEVVEGPLERGAQGYILEARIPLSAVPGGNRIGEARAALRLHDVDSEAHPVANDESASAVFDSARPEAMPLFGATAVSSSAVDEFLQRSGLVGVRPSVDLHLDVVQGDEPDRVLLIRNTLLVVPTNARAGSSSFAFATLPFARDAVVSLPTAASLTANTSKTDLTFDVQAVSGSERRTTRYFLTFERGTVDVLGALDVRREAGPCVLTNRVAIEPANRNHGATISVDFAPPRGTCPDPRATNSTGGAPFLIPGGPVLRAVYHVENSGLGAPVLTPNPNWREPTTRVTATPPPADSGGGSPARVAGDTLAQFRNDQHVDANAPARFGQDANVAESSANERVTVLDRSIVVTGPAFRGGTGYAFTTIPVAAASDILNMTVDDISGDGVGEILVRARQDVGNVTREILLVHRLTQHGLTRVMAVEVRRTQGTNSVQALLAVQGNGRSRRLTVRPGSASGWTQSSYPFAPDASPGMEALVLPWARTGVRYEWNDATSAFRATPLAR